VVIAESNFNPSFVDQQDIQTGLMVDNKMNSSAITTQKECTNQSKINDGPSGDSLFVYGKTQSNLHRLD
jgi:hypothetical protein